MQTESKEKQEQKNKAVEDLERAIFKKEGTCNRLQEFVTTVGQVECPGPLLREECRKTQACLMRAQDELESLEAALARARNG